MRLPAWHAGQAPRPRHMLDLERVLGADTLCAIDRGCCAQTGRQAGRPALQRGSGPSPACKHCMHRTVLLLCQQRCKLLPNGCGLLLVAHRPGLDLFQSTAALTASDLIAQTDAITPPSAFSKAHSGCNKPLELPPILLETLESAISPLPCLIHKFASPLEHQSEPILPWQRSLGFGEAPNPSHFISVFAGSEVLTAGRQASARLAGDWRAVAQKAARVVGSPQGPQSLIALQQSAFSKYALFLTKFHAPPGN